MSNINAKQTIDLHTRDEGEGNPLVLLHGFTGSGESMSQIAKSLPSRVISPDLIGHGLSPSPEALEYYRVESMVEQIRRIAESRVDGPISICGYSMGARLALSYASRYQDDINALIMIGGTPGIEDKHEADERARLDTQLAARIESEGIAKFASYWEALPMFASQLQLSSDLRINIRRIRLSQRPHAIANALRMGSTGMMSPMWEMLPELWIPTLLITGEYDVKFTGIAKRMEHILPRGKHVIISGVGHAAHTEDPKKVAECIKEFLRTHE